jgi:hypothetical protein
MNPIFPHFNFDTWFTDFYVTSRSFANPDWADHDADLLQDMRFMFMNQIHLESEDTWCGACDYMRALTDFNKFMAVISEKMPTLEEVVAIFIKMQYPLDQEIVDIIAATICGGGKSSHYLESGEEFFHTPAMADRIGAFLTRLEINVKRKTEGNL